MNKIIAALACFIAAPLAAQQGAVPPAPVAVKAPADPDAIPLYPKLEGASKATEQWERFMGGDIIVRNVTLPTLTPVLPDPKKATGAAVIVAPGGAFMILAADHEGVKVARALADRGIAAFILKYRTIPTPKDGMAARKFMGENFMKEVSNPMDGALLKASFGPTDARAALAMVRAGASKWGIDPSQVGMIGFSAGAMTARRAALDGDPAGRPNFIGYIYGPQDAETVPANAPPMFNAIALDDPLFPNKGFPIAQSWLAAKRPVEVHAYQKGGHGFGLGKAGETNMMMLDQFTSWLKMQGFLSPKTAK